MKDSGADGATKVIAKGNIITTVTTEKKAEEEKAEQEDAQTDAAETPEPVVTTPLRQDTKVNDRPPTRRRATAAFHLYKEAFGGLNLLFLFHDLLGDLQLI